MHINYIVYNQNTEDERHYMKIVGTCITATGVTKQYAFDQLKQTLNSFITELKLLRQIEIGNIQETQAEALSFEAQINKIDKKIIKKVIHDQIEEINKEKFKLIEAILDDNFDNCPIDLYRKIKQAIRFGNGFGGNL